VYSRTTFVRSKLALVFHASSGTMLGLTHCAPLLSAAKSSRSGMMLGAFKWQPSDAFFGISLGAAGLDDCYRIEKYPHK
jgi:hypothetical protein